MLWSDSFLSASALDLQLHDAPVQFVKRFGLRIDLHAQPARRLVHEIDRFVRQKAVGDCNGANNCAAATMAPSVMRTPWMDLVLLLQSPQDRDRILDGGSDTKTG